MDDSRIYEVLLHLEERGAFVCAPDEEGFSGFTNSEGIRLTAAQVVLWLKDPDAGFAALADMSREAFLMWRMWRDDGYRCRGETKRGTQCCSYLSRATDLWQFIPGFSEYCDRHQPPRPANTLSYREKWHRRMDAAPLKQTEDK